MQFKNLKKQDKQLESLIQKEIHRQKETINLIASENFVSPAVLEALGSPLVNKYSEGYPSKRYYPGNEYYDQIEELAKSRAKKVFSLNEDWEVNVQPYSGSPANIAIYLALTNSGDTLMGMRLDCGGHLSHGHFISASGRIWKIAQYGVDPKTGLIDYDEVLKIAEIYKPKIIISGFSAYPRQIDFKKFGDIAKKVNAYHMADISHIAGLISAGLHPSPFPYSDIVMTTTHKTLRGPRGAVIFSKKELVEKINKAVFPGMQGGPHNHNIAAKAVAFQEALKPSFKKYQKQIIKNAEIFAKSLLNKGFNLVSGGTDNHLILIDLKNIGIDGKSAEEILEKANILANRNAIFGDEKPLFPSGIRFGTPALTSRGFKEKEMKMVAEWIKRLLINKDQSEKIKKEAIILSKKFPLSY